MTKQIKVEAPLTRAERLRVTLGVAALGAAATTAVVAGVAHEISKPDTHEETVDVRFGDNTPTIYDAALKLRKQGATESVRELQDELTAAEPGADGVVHEGDVAQVRIDVENQ
ncbi:hypothetical protein BH09PAT4_BH09PAT4_04200 [soil metagenome]